MSETQEVVEYISNEFPGTTRVSQRSVQTFLRDNAYGVTFFVGLFGTTPDGIKTMPNIKLVLTLQSMDNPNTVVVHNLLPKEIPTVIVDAVPAYNGLVIKEDKSQITFKKSLNMTTELPASYLQGNLYFEVSKTKDLVPVGHVIQLF